jgi:histidinol-phosphate aminotransferase
MNGVMLGVGGRPGADPGALSDLAAKALADHGLCLADVTVVTTLDRRADHEGVRRLLAAAAARLVTWTAEQLADQPVDHPSATVARHLGTSSVAEAAVRAAAATPTGTPVRADDWVVVVALEAGHDLHHHGDVEVVPGMLDFAVNVHADRPPQFLRDALVAAVDELARYPDPRPAEAVVAAAHGVPPESVLLTHGAAEAFTLVAQQPWRSPLVVHPQFTEPEAALLAAGHRPDRLLLAADDGFRLTRTPAAGHDLVLVGNPTNPTSRLHGPDEIEALAGEDRLVVVDEAFMDAVEPVSSPRHSRAREAAGCRDLLVVRSLTKTFSIAGLRVGYLVGHPDLLARLAAQRTPWPVGTLAAAAAVACLSTEGEEYAAAVRAALPGRLAYLRDGLVRTGFTVPPDPRGPFLLAHRHDAAQVRESLRTQGIAVRRADSFPGLDPTWLRFAARDAAAVDVLLDALRRSSAPRRR